MIRVNSLLDAGDASKKPGLDSSLNKWERIVNALDNIQYSASTYCGLCYGNNLDCSVCIIGGKFRCISEELYATFKDKLYYAKQAADKMVTILLNKSSGLKK